MLSAEILGQLYPAEVLLNVYDSRRIVKICCSHSHIYLLAWRIPCPALESILHKQRTSVSICMWWRRLEASLSFDCGRRSSPTQIERDSAAASTDSVSQYAVQPLVSPLHAYDSAHP